jgi:tRNA dimethylallyltransferase
VYLLSGRPISEWQQDTRPAHGLVFERWALVPTDRAALHARIAERFAVMMQTGLLEEVRALRSRPALSAASPSLRAVGYRQLWQYLDGPQSPELLAAAVERAVAASRQLAKRQLTWINGDPGWNRLDPAALQGPDGGVSALLAGCRRFVQGTNGMVNLS